VLVGVNSSAPRAVTVGVNVSGVGVAVANRFCVGIGVSLTDGVGVSLAGTGVGETSSGGRLGIAEHPARITSRRTWMSLFMMNLCIPRYMLKG
jgi:hypothetical protein